MAILFRVAYNNQGWAAPCESPGKDEKCRKCFDGSLNIIAPDHEDETCSGLCWERDLCRNFEWGNTVKHRRFGSDVTGGDTAFFVFRQLGGGYTLWATTKVTAINIPPIRDLTGHEIGYEHWLRFEPFKPLPEQKWVKNLSDRDLTGTKWGQGGFRYLTDKKEEELLARIEGIQPRGDISVEAIKPDKEAMLVLPMPAVLLKKLEEAAQADGRSIEDISRQAIAEWLKKSS
jgi:hypothetical protein